ncbi:MAG: hypothetical protein QM497_09385 [Sulfurimonas sp.]
MEKITSYSIIHKDMLIEAFLAYFIGLVISRISSIIIEPCLKKVGFVKFTEYKDFVLASKSDKKIELLSESNNMYRVFISSFFILIIVILYEKYLQDILTGYTSYIAITGLLILFLFSYRKQTSYITQRVEFFTNKQNKDKENE